ncbi:hypothetical protein EI94DRAFT_686048 [Lactarius quietus]|nr:hypothetical protein EI94DRAFT_686048 [Lactarius quietus]
MPKLASIHELIKVPVPKRVYITQHSGGRRSLSNLKASVLDIDNSLCLILANALHSPSCKFSMHITCGKGCNPTLEYPWAKYTHWRCGIDKAPTTAMTVSKRRKVLTRESIRGAALAGRPSPRCQPNWLVSCTLGRDRPTMSAIQPFGVSNRLYWTAFALLSGSTHHDRSWSEGSIAGL